MKKTLYNKNIILDQLNENTRLQIAEVNEIYLHQTAEVLQSQADNGGWSIVQCLEHLNTYSAYYLPLIEKILTSSTKNQAESYYSSWIGNYFIRLMKDNSGKKYKAKAMHQPGAVLNAYTVLVQFLENQNKFLKLISMAQEADLNQGRIPVSILPFLKLNLGDVLQFMGAHQQRHLLQARRNYRSQQLSVVSL